MSAATSEGPLELLIRNSSEVLTLSPTPQSDDEALLRAVPKGAVGVRQGRVAFLGAEADLPAELVGPRTQVVDAQGGFVGPGFVDPHTHLVFAGDRSVEFELRCQGASYLEIAQQGGGIINTVNAVRRADTSALVELALPRLRRLLESGVTTMEIKSGYGLTLADEVKMLKAAGALRGRQPIEIVTTLLCAHALPAEWKHDRASYVRLCTEEIIPAVASERLARFCDAFCETGAFTIEETRAVLEAGLRHGLLPKLHADQLSSMGASALAAELGAVSADHLEELPPEGAERLARAKVTAVLLPVSTLFLQLPRYAPGRRLWDAGAAVALATNVNPGSAMSENHALTLGLACLQNGLSAGEAYWAATRGGALALGLAEHGRLAIGGPADVVVFRCASHRHLPYHLGVNHVGTVIKGGRVVHQAASSPGLAATLCAG